MGDIALEMPLPVFGLQQLELKVEFDPSVVKASYISGLGIVGTGFFR